jgi:hypothetical protein
VVVDADQNHVFETHGDLQAACAAVSDGVSDTLTEGVAPCPANGRSRPSAMLP